jgi:hypothetical protein
MQHHLPAISILSGGAEFFTEWKNDVEFAFAKYPCAK